MKQKAIWLWGVSAAFLLLFTAWAGPLFISSRRPSQINFKIKAVYSQKPSLKDAFDVSAMSYRHIVAEGPCEAGGILEQLPIDLKNYIPLKNIYDEETVTLVWLYKMKPLEVTRHNDLFGEDSLTIMGTPTEEPKVYFAVVPKSLVEPDIHWVYVETK